MGGCKSLCLTLLVTIFIGVNSGKVNAENETLPTVNISQGCVQGFNQLTRYNRIIASFLGIPYAQPPIGDLRFSSPVAADSWDGTLVADTDGASCMNVEDCLYVNVHTPQLPGDDESCLLPVMVVIPGGAFKRGNGNSTNYGPQLLLDADIVLVSFNYRLGPFGFLSTGDEVAPGNWGMKDQVLLLQWVQDNIAYFGGDPDQVTIFGQSAGGASAQLLTLSDTTAGLFHRFVSQSSGADGFKIHQSKKNAANNTRRLGEALGCSTTTMTVLIDCLREFTTDEVLTASSGLGIWDKFPEFLWLPTDEPDIDGAFMTDSPMNLIARGKMRDLPSITGNVKDESLAYLPGPLPDSELYQGLFEKFDERLPLVLQYFNQVDDVSYVTEALKEFYFNNDLTTNATEVWTQAIKLFSDAMYNYSIFAALLFQYKYAINTPWYYSFEYRGTRSYASTYADAYPSTQTAVVHSDDLLYLYPQLRFIFRIPENELAATDHEMIDTMVELFTSFVINGVPSTSALDGETWEPYSSKGNYLRIGNGILDPTLSIDYNLRAERMEFWKELMCTSTGFCV